MKTEDKINDGGPAFPRPASPAEFTDHCQDGPSLRDYFAAKALAALVSSPDRRNCIAEMPSELIPDCEAMMAYQFADAMLRARTQPEAK